MGWTSQIVVANQVIIEGSQDGLFIYSGFPATGNLIGSWAAQAGTDPYGNPYPTGINVIQGSLSGVSVSGATISGASISTSTLASPVINTPAIGGGSMTDTTYTLDTSGGALLVYSTTSTTTTFSTAGQTTYTTPSSNCPPTALVKAWGGGAGGGGGNASTGGEGGGGGEFAEEAAYPITANTTYQVVVGGGGTGGATNNPGNSGGQSSFNGVSGVVANGGNAGSGFVGGLGGSGSTNTVHSFGGRGGGDASQNTGGCGGGGSGGATGNGGSASDSTSSTGSAGGAAGSGGGAAGGAGGNSSSNGVAGSAPGAAGGGAGAATTTTSKTISYSPTNTYSYYGTDATQNPAGQENHNGVMLQGQFSGGSSNGTQYSYALYDYNKIASDWSGFVIDSVTVKLVNQHSWYNSGMDVQIWATFTSSFGATHNYTSDTTGGPATVFVAEGGTVTADITSFFATNGNSRSIRLGPGPGVGSGGNLNYYGYFTGGTSGPVVTITGHTGTTKQAGNGAAGQVQVTLTNAATLIASAAGVAGTDSFGNNYPAGVFLAGQATPTAPTATGSVLYSASTSGAPGAIQTSGLAGQFPLVQVDTGVNSDATTGVVALTKAWSIPSGNAVAGTTYRIRCRGTGAWPNPGVAGTPNLTFNGTNTAIFPNAGSFSSAFMTAGHGFVWECELYVTCVTTGSGGTARVGGWMGFTDATAHTSPSIWVWDSGTGTLGATISFNTTASTTINFGWQWASAPGGGGTIACQQSIFYREGP